jgi:hypothetical protein
MPSIEKLFRLEIEFHRRLRTQAPGVTACDIHTILALLYGYEPLVRAAAPVTGQDIERLHVIGDNYTSLERQLQFRSSVPLSAC